MKNIIAMMLFLLISNDIYAATDVQNNKVMNLFELNIKPEQESQFDEIARATISFSLEQQKGTLAMYSLVSKTDPHKAYMFEVYSSRKGQREHLNSANYNEFILRADSVINNKKKVALIPEFLGDKRVLQNEKTINNLVVVDVKPEFQAEFRDIVLPEMRQSLRVESGVLAMYAARDINNVNRWYFYEIYASEVDYNTHRQTPHFKHYIAQTVNMAVSKESVPVKPVFLLNKGGLNVCGDVEC